jgi:hypothetical protein
MGSRLLFNTVLIPVSSESSTQMSSPELNAGTLEAVYGLGV